MLWLVLAWFLSERFLALHGARDALRMLFEMSFQMPLVTLDGKAYTLVDFLTLPLLLAALWVVVTGFVHLLRVRVLAPAGVENGLQAAITVLLRYALVFFGAIVVLQARGIDLRSLAILASVLGVGIGFGLQNIANNFVSGLLINIELPVRPGDFVRVGEFQGTVQRVGPRSTEIRTLDEVAILVPNSRFLEHEVVNWSHGNPLSRVHVPVGVAYGSDVARVRMALLEAVQGHPGVQRDPRPRVELRRFGDSALDFEVLVWTREPRKQFSLASDLNFRIVERLQRHGIAIPFPQRDLHLRSPQLTRLLGAVTQRLLPDAPIDADAVPATRLDAAEAQAPFESPDDPAAWSDAALDALVTRMRGAGGVPIRDRRHRLVRHPRSFVGHEATAWLMEREGLTRDEAVALGQRLVESGTLHHVLDEHGFRDGPYFYRFRADEASA
jgi:small-conductance mechanosensitive channel